MDSKLSFLEEAPLNTQVKVGIAALVIHDNKILLEEREDCSLWGCPGGRLDPGENISQTAIRETKEETNIDIKINRIFGIYSDPQYGTVRYYEGDESPQQVVDIYLLATPTSFDIKKSSESLNVKFFDLNEAPSNLTPFVKEVIKDYRNNQSSKDTILK